MAIAPRHSRRSSIDIWPGFVDALSQLLMVIIFILLVFTAGQLYLSAALSGRNQALQKLQHQVDELANLLSLEKQANSKLTQGAANLSAQLASVEAERAKLKAQVADLGLQAQAAAGLKTELAAEQQKNSQAQTEIAGRDTRLAALSSRADKAEQALAAEKRVSSDALARVDALNAQIVALREQLTRIAAALDLSEAKAKTQEAKIADLGKKLNLALVNKVEELSRYRSEFFGRLRDILGDRPGIRVVGDRFVFQSEVLFAPGSADLSDDAKKALDPVIGALKEIAAKIPPDIDWMLRVDGHTDHRPISNAQFPSNWELSTARALSVVRYAISQGIPAERLAAAGFADLQPIDPADTPEAYRKNRRIELKLTER
jgi:chemotaxis protein MotB